MLIVPGGCKQHCIFCPNTDGAFKQTTTTRWSHLLCAIWIPEVRLANPAYMEPVDGMELVPKSRWRLVSPARPPSCPRPPKYDQTLTLG